MVALRALALVAALCATSVTGAIEFVTVPLVASQGIPVQAFVVGGPPNDTSHVVLSLEKVCLYALTFYAHTHTHTYIYTYLCWYLWRIEKVELWFVFVDTLTFIHTCTHASNTLVRHAISFCTRLLPPSPLFHAPMFPTY